MLPKTRARRARSHRWTTAGSNSAEKYAHATWEVASPNVPGAILEAEISYKSSVKEGSSWHALSLDESLVGANEADNGEPYGKVRVDVTIPALDFDGSVGSTYFLYCHMK